MSLAGGYIHSLNGDRRVAWINFQGSIAPGRHPFPFRHGCTAGRTGRRSKADGPAAGAGVEALAKDPPANPTDHPREERKQQQGEGQPAQKVEEEPASWAWHQQQQGQQQPGPGDGAIHQRWKRRSFSNQRSNAAIASMPSHANRRLAPSHTPTARTPISTGARARTTTPASTRAPMAVQARVRAPGRDRTEGVRGATNTHTGGRPSSPFAGLSLDKRGCGSPPQGTTGQHQAQALAVVEENTHEPDPEGQNQNATHHSIGLETYAKQEQGACEQEVQEGEGNAEEQRTRNQRTPGDAP